MVAAGTVATISAINTTLSAVAAAGALTVVVTDASDVSNGSRLWLQDVPEEILVQSVSGTTLTLRRPLLNPHVSGATAEGTRVSYVVSAADANMLFWRGRIVWVLDSVTSFSPVEVTKYPLRNTVTVQDIQDVDTNIARRLDKTEDPERAISAATEIVFEMIGAIDAVKVFTMSTDSLKFVVAYQFMVNHYLPLKGDSETEMLARFEKQRDQALERILPSLPRDRNQDGTVAENDILTSTGGWLRL